MLAPLDSGGFAEDESVGLAPAELGEGSIDDNCDEENGVITCDEEIIDFDLTTKRRCTEPARVSVRTKRPNPKFLFSQQQRAQQKLVDTGAVQVVCVCLCVVCVCLYVCVCVFCVLF